MDCYTKYKRRDQTTLKCSYCGEEFNVSKNRVSKVSHCSRECYTEFVRSDKTRVCKLCNKEKPIIEFLKHSKNKDIRRRYCYECEKEKSRKRAEIPRVRWLQGRKRSKGWNISLERFEFLIVNPCHYCGGQLNKTGCGLDRKDNGIGYEEDNVVPCCCVCNKVKMDHFTYEEMMLLSPILRKIKENQNANGM